MLEADSWLPQLALGAEWKHLDPGASVAPILAGVGAKTSGIDLYLSATKLFLGPGVLVNATVRATRANQNGLLGFGASGHNGYQLQPEFSVALAAARVRSPSALEYRTKPDHLAFAGDALPRAGLGTMSSSPGRRTSGSR